jgi:hypothetical protein
MTITLSTAEKQKLSEPSRVVGFGTFACGLARKVSTSVTLKTQHLDTAIERAENEFFAIKSNLNSDKCIVSPTVHQAAEDYLKSRWDVELITS